MSSLLVGNALLPDHQRMVKVTLGSCLFVFKGETCDDCGHPLSRHRDYGQTPVEIPPSLPQCISPRSDTVRKLAELLDKQRVVHVRGTPSSGKTTLARLLEIYYIEQGQSVKFMTGWSIQEDQDQLQESLLFGIENLLYTNTVFIIDEAEESFADHALWLGPIKSQSGASGGARICLLSSYGSPTTGSPCYPAAQIPLFLEPSQRVSITKQSDPESPGICLFYNKEEFENAVDRLCSHLDTAFNMDSSARTSLYYMTKGHPGAVEALASYVFRKYEQAIKDSAIRTVTKELLNQSFYDESRVFRDLKKTAVFTSFPLPNLLTAPAINVLRRVLEYGSVPFDLQDDGVRLCYEKGWLHSDLTSTSTSEDPKTICFLPTRQHMKFVEYILHASHLEPFPFDRFPCLAALCEAILKRFSRTRLLSEPETSYLPSKCNRPPEAPFQDEWYRCFSSLVGYGVGISSKWSCIGHERVDFRIIGPAWGVELLRDGDQIYSVCDRFQPHGLYHPLIEEGKMTDWLILDCRHTAPQKCHILDAKLWRVVFKDNYTSAYVLNGENVVVVPEFHLLE